ncbi:MAG: sporulation protein YabP [Lachnospiraceae bacterium]|nr:sporulation protein YabP [Lachnospiraceae bacterium]
MDDSQNGHRLTMYNRGGLVMTGITDVISFNTQEALLESVCGVIFIKGTDLKIGKICIESGDVTVDGKVDTIQYSEAVGYAKKGKKLLKRLFS